MNRNSDNPATSWRIHRRVIVLVIIFLVAIDAAVRVALPLYVQSDAHRLPSDDLQTLRLWKEKIRGSKGVNVVFLGDSFLFGGGVRDENETIPWYVARELAARYPGRKIDVCNLSLAGCTPADSLLILNYIADAAPDLVVYDVNVRWFNDDEQQVARTNLYNLTPGYTVPGTSGVASAATRPAALESRLSLLMERCWALYRYRVPLDYLLLGATPQAKISLALQEGSLKYLLPQAQKDTPSQLELYRPWYTKTFTADDMKVHVGGRLGDVRLDDDNMQWQCYQEMVALLQRTRIPAVFFLMPRNWTLLQQGDLVAWDGFTESQQTLAETAQRAGITVLDYTQSLPDNVFVDWAHPNAEGNRQMAHLLADDLQKSGLLDASKAEE